jgi:tetratricopeptide (TPR) repeat protein
MYMKKNKTLLTLLLLTFSITATANIFKCKKDDGTVSYQEKECESSKPDMLTLKGITDQQSYQQSLGTLKGELSNSSITMLTFNWWKSFKKEVSENFLHFKYTDDSGDTNISLLIDFIVVKEDKKINQSVLIEMLKKAAEPLKKTSIEQSFKYETMKTQVGFGYYTTFTDANLIDKKSFPPGEYLYTTKGFMLMNDLLIHFTLLSDDKEAQNHIFALQFLANGILIEAKQEASKTDESLLDQAYNAYYEGKKRESVNLFEELVSQEPESFKAWIGFCLSARDTNRLQTAFIACDKAAQLKPNDPDVLNSILNLLVKARLYDQGLELAKQLVNISIKEQVIDTINNLGFYAMLDRSLDVATQAFAIVKKEVGSNQKVLLDEAMLAYIQKDSPTALKIIKTMQNQSDELDQLLEGYITSINKNEVIYPENFNKESYTLIPKRLQAIGSGKLIDQKVDGWVTKIFPILGIGKLQLQVPEDWVEGLQFRQQSPNINSLSLLISDKNLKETVIRVEVGKVSNEWSVKELSEQMLSTLKAFLPENSVQIKPLNGDKKGYVFEETIESQTVTMSYYSINELISNISLEINSESFNLSNQRKELIKRIVNSVKIIEINSSSLQPVDLKNTNKLAVGVQGGKSANDMDLPAPPEAYDWVRMPLAQAAFVKPKGWFEVNKQTKDAITYVISKEKADDDNQFNTGLTLIAIKNLKSKKGISPTEFALKMVAEIKKSAVDTVLQIKDISQGPFSSILVKYENSPPGLEPIIIHKVLTANEKTGSLYMILFEAPKVSWDKAWENGEVMMKYFLLDDEF